MKSDELCRSFVAHRSPLRDQSPCSQSSRLAGEGIGRVEGCDVQQPRTMERRSQGNSEPSEGGAAERNATKPSARSGYATQGLNVRKPSAQ